VDDRLREGPLVFLQKRKFPQDLASLRGIRVRLQASLRLDEMPEGLRVLLAAPFDRRDLPEQPRDSIGPTTRLGLLDRVTIFQHGRLEVSKRPEGVAYEFREDACGERSQGRAVGRTQDRQQFG